jgi:hypothetical protein
MPFASSRLGAESQAISSDWQTVLIFSRKRGGGRIGSIFDRVMATRLHGRQHPMVAFYPPGYRG